MIKSIFGSNRPVVIGLLVIPAVAFGTLALVYSARPDFSLSGPLFDLFNDLLGSGIYQVILGVIVNLVGAVLVNFLYNAHDYAERENYFPALIYFLFSSLQLSWEYFNPVFIGNLFVLLALRRLLRMYRVQEVTAMIYDAGVFLCIGALFYPPFVLAFPLLWISLIQLRTFNFREWLVPISGIVTPLIYVAIVYWWFDLEIDFFGYVQFDALHFKELIAAHSIFFYLLLIVSLIAFFVGFLVFVREMGISTVHKKNTKKVFISLTFILFAVWLLSNSLTHEQAGLPGLFAIPVAVFGGVLFSRTRRRKFNTILFYVWLILLLFYPIFTEVV